MSRIGECDFEVFDRNAVIYFFCLFFFLLLGLEIFFSSFIFSIPWFLFVSLWNAESGWQLGQGSDESYPERPEEADCIFYLRTGYCGYGPRCRFNHPRDRSMVIRLFLWLRIRLILGRIGGSLFVSGLIMIFFSFSKISSDLVVFCACRFDVSL